MWLEGNVMSDLVWKFTCSETLMERIIVFLEESAKDCGIKYKIINTSVDELENINEEIGRAHV